MSPPNTSPNGDARVYPRKPPRATLEQKIRILDYFHRLDRPQLETVDNFRNEVAISTLTFNEWLKNEQEYRQRYRELGSQFEKHARRKVTYKYDKINRAMDLLVQQRLSRGEEVTEPVLRNYWQIYAHQFGVENPKRLIGFSHGWLSQFKKRHGLGRANQGSAAGGINSGTASGTTATTSITTGTGTTTTGITPNTTVTNTAAPLLHVHGDVTTSNNEKLLADPASEDELGGAPTHLPQHQPQRQHQHQRQLQEPAGHFQPQRTLSFPQNLAYLPPASPPRNRLTERHPIDPINGNRNVNVNVDVDVDVDELAELLARAMQLSLNTRKPFDAHDIEHFLVTVADRFFQDHQYDYPQTVHLYEEFKSLFASERLINLRSSQDRVPVLVLTPGQVLVPVSGPGPTPLEDSRAPRSSSLALIPQSLALAHGPQMALAALLLLDQPGLRSLHGLRSRSRSRTRASSLGPSAGHGTGLAGQHLPGEPLALRHSHMHLRQQLQHQQHQIQHQHQHHHQQQHQHQHQHQHQEQQVLQQVQQTQLQQTQLQQNQHVYQLEQTNPLDADEQSMDNIFLRQARHKQRAFTGTGTGTGTSTGTGEEAWLNSELRKLWEQNKLMLS